MFGTFRNGVPALAVRNVPERRNSCTQSVDGSVYLHCMYLVLTFVTLYTVLTDLLTTYFIINGRSASGSRLDPCTSTSQILVASEDIIKFLLLHSCQLLHEPRLQRKVLRRQHARYRGQ